MKGHRKIILVLVICAIAGLTSPAWRSFAQEKYTELQLFAKVLNLVSQYYVEEVDAKKLIYGGIKGMLKELDPHTNFLPPEIFKEFESETAGEFGGLGIEITVQNGILTVISPIEDTPAWKAGIKAGDKIVEIDGTSTKGMSLAEAAQKLKGKTGAKIKLAIFREGFETPKDFIVQRGVVKIRSVKATDLEEGYIYVRLTSFIDNSFDDLEKTIKEYTEKYKKTGGLKGLILDLRRNPGGLLDQAVKISDLFLNEGTIVSTMGRNKKEKEVLYAKKVGTLPDFPLIVLVDEYSASASEILAGALQDNKRALVMGQKSFGKGSVQSVVKLGDGSGLKLTVARYYTPSGKSIQAEGIVPDVFVENFDAETLDKATVKRNIRRERDIRGHLRGDDEEDEEDGGKRPNSDGAPSGGPMQWWLGANEKEGEKLKGREKLLKEDFQVLQAYNYLKTWKVLKDFKSN